ncbi:MAG: hypothetical protein M0R00_06385 [Candidatus Omnitrophica bacterium]|jgi:hypothetical protein|nr:hypothetical protein [Candidatus Omnitrophota bacterium]
MSAIAELKAILGLDATKFKAETQKVTTLTSSLQKSISGISGMLAGAFSAGALIAFGRNLLKVADDLQTAANVFGTSMDTMIAWKSVMAESGIGADRFMKLFGRLASAQADVDKGLKTYTDSLDKMNIAHEEFVGLKIDKVMELLARKYGEAENKTAFLGEAAKLLGVRGLELIEVFQRLNEKGMEKFTEEAKKAAGGMKELAAASDTMENFFNTIIMKSAEAVGALSSLTKANERLISSGGIFGAMKRFFGRSGGPVFGIDELTGQPEKKELTGTQWAGGKLMTGDAGDGAGFPATTAQKEAAAKKAEAAAKKAESDNEKAQALGRSEYFRQLKEQDAVERLQSDYAKSLSDLNHPGAVRGSGMQADSLMRIGGSIGLSRPGIEKEDRQLRILQESKQVQEEFARKLQELIDRQESDRERGE